MNRLRQSLIVAVLCIALLASGTLFVRQAQAIGIGDLLKIGGVVLVVSAFDKEIDKTINNTLAQNEVKSIGASKVVPIISIGRGAYIGAAQVVGTPADVKRVKAVATVETTLDRLDGAFMVPITTVKPGGGTKLDRVEGVGISAIVDLHI